MRRARNVYLRAGGGGGGGGAGEESARKRRARAPETSAKVGYSAPMPPPLWQRSEGGGGEVAVAGLEGGGSAAAVAGAGDFVGGFRKIRWCVWLTGRVPQGSSAVLNFSACVFGKVGA